MGRAAKNAFMNESANGSEIFHCVRRAVERNELRPSSVASPSSPAERSTEGIQFPTERNIEICNENIDFERDWLILEYR